MSHPPANFGQEAPAARLHTTSDLLVLLAVEGRPFGEVAAAVAARFGGGGESQAWLAKTLVTLLRDGLLFNAVEKLNAAYLLRFAAPGVPGAREALLHLTLPGSGEPAAVRAWASGLVSATAPGQAHQQPAGAEQLHHWSPQQVLGGAMPPPLGSQPQVHHPEPLTWQGAGATASAVRHPAAAMESRLASNSRPALPTLPSQEQQQEQHQQERNLQLDQQQRLRSLAALLQEAAQSPLVPALQLRLVQALASPVAAAALTEPLAAAVDGSSMARSFRGDREGSLEPHDMRGLVEHNSSVAAELLVALSSQHPEAAALFAAAVAELPMSAQSVECMSAVVGRAQLPDWVLTTFVASCMQDTSACQDGGRQSRQVKLLCACVSLVLQRQPAALADSLPELLAFCIQARGPWQRSCGAIWPAALHQSRHKQASELYRQLRDLEQAGG